MDPTQYSHQNIFSKLIHFLDKLHLLMIQNIYSF